MFRRLRPYALRRIFVRTLSINLPRLTFYKNSSNIFDVRHYIDNKLWRFNSLRFYADLPAHTNVPLPALSPTMESGGLANWLKKEGDLVNEGDPLCEIETDKASMGFDSPYTGYIAKILVPAGSKDVKLGTIICVIVEKQEDIVAFKDFKAEAVVTTGAPPPAVSPPPAPAPPPVAVPPPIVQPQKAVGFPAHGSKGRISLMEKGLAIARNRRLGKTKVKGKKPGIARRVVTFPAGAKFVDIPATQTQLALAQRMLTSKLTIPHYVISANCNIDKLISLKKQLNALLKQSKRKMTVGLSDILVKIAATSMMDHPDFNAVWLGDKIRKFDNADIGIACFYNGFVVPVIQKVNSKGVIEIAKETTGFEENADSLTDDSAGALCIVNLSWIDTAMINYIINPNQSSVLGIGAVQHRLIQDKKGFKQSQYITCSLTGDHRVIDGALAAIWLRTFKNYIENPISMIL